MDPTADETPTPEAEDQSQSTTGAPQEEGTSAETESTAEFFSDQFDPSTLDEPLQQRYRDMQADYTRKTQSLAEQRKQAEAELAFMESLRNPDSLGDALHQIREAYGEEAFLEALGYGDREPEEGPGEPEPYLTRAEWEQHQAQEAEKRAQTEQEQYLSSVDEHLASEWNRINADRKQAGRPELTEKQWRTIAKNAVIDTPPGGIPDVRAAFEDFEGLMDEGLRGWAATKATTHTASGGQAATEAPGMDTHSERVDWMLSRLQGGPST